MISGNATVILDQCKFNYNYAYFFGGGIYASNFAKVLIKGNTGFEGNRALDQGDDIYAADTKNSLILNSVSFVNPSAKSSIYADQISLEMYGTTLKNMKSGASLQGGAIQCIDCNSIYVESCRFDNLQS